MKQERRCWIEGIGGDLVGQEFNLDKDEVILGRAEGLHVQILDPRVSRDHALIRFSTAGCSIEDLSSTSGTLVNGEIVQTAELKDGDTITIGETSFRFHDKPAKESVPVAEVDDDDVATVVEILGEPASAGETARCAQCGASLQDHENFCGQCGAPRQVSETQRPAAESPSKPAPTRRASQGSALPPRAAFPPPPPRGNRWIWIVVFGGGLLVLALAITTTLFALGFLGEDESEQMAAIPDPTETPLASIIDTTEIIVPTEVFTPLIPPTLTPTIEVVEIPTLQPTVTPPEIGVVIGSAHQIAFASNRGGGPQIYLINVDGTDERQVTDLAGGACQPAWSPDGTKLAYTSPCIANSDEYLGSSVFVLNVDPQGIPSDPSPIVVTVGGGDYDPDWSYDGLRLAFTSWRTGRPQIFTIGSDGNGLRNINDDLAFNWSPSWAPDGSRIAILTGRGGEKEIWLVPDDGGEEIRYTHSDGKDIARPDWSPDGATILFEKVVDGLTRLATAPVADGGVRETMVCQEGRLSFQPMGEPAWSPDGQWIAFEAWPEGVNHNIAIMRADCTDYHEVTTHPALDFDAAWRPEP